MISNQTKKPRKQQILEAFVQMLEASPGARITTAALAKKVGVSEAALYRHFPSKSKMFEGLIEFIEATVFASLSDIIADNTLSSTEKCENIIHMILKFSESNPGITRILTGDALAGESVRLHQRVVQFFDRLEMQLKQILRDSGSCNEMGPMSTNAIVNMWLAHVEGKIAQFVRSQFRNSPTADWVDQWSFLVGISNVGEFRPPESSIAHTV